MWRYANPVTIHWTSDVSQLLLNLLPPGQGVLFAYPQFQEPFAASLLGGPLNGVPVFNGIESNPTPDQVQLAIDFALAIAPRWILAIGGGSVLDTAKLVRLALAGGCQRIDELLETVPGEPLAPSPLLVAIPTTHGTGAELTMWTTVWDKGGGRKLSLSHPNNYPDIAIYSPALTYSLPLPLSFTTTLDALSHALEALWNRNGNPVSDELASAAVQLVSENLERLADPVPHPVRANLLRASLYAGLAFSNTKTAAAHSISYPLTLRLGIPHGIACAMSLASLWRINSPGMPLKAEHLRLRLGGEDVGKILERLLRFVAAQVPFTLSAYGARPTDLTALVQESFTKGRMDNNLVDLSQSDVRAILEAIF